MNRAPPAPRTGRTSAQQQASRSNGAKSSGPTSPEGKAISSRNALRHGAFSPATLLFGESERDYRGTVENWLETLPAHTPGMVDLVLRVADVAFRQERIRRQEQRLMAEVIEERLSKTAALAKLAAARDALSGVQGLALVAEGVGASMPAERVRPLIPGMARVVEMASATAPWELARALGTTIEELTLDTIIEIAPETFHALGRAARAVEQALVARNVELERAVEQERERISRAVLFGDSQELRRLDRARARLATEFAQCLAAYEKARQLAGDAASRGPAPPVTVDLHVLGRR